MTTCAAPNCYVTTLPGWEYCIDHHNIGGIYVGDWVTVTYSLIPSGSKIVFDGQVIAIRDPSAVHAAGGVAVRSIQVEPIIPAYKTQWWHRWQVESYREVKA